MEIFVVVGLSVMRLRFKNLDLKFFVYKKYEFLLHRITAELIFTAITCVKISYSNQN